MTVKQLTIRRLWPRPLTSTSRMSFFYVLLFSLSLQTTAAQVEPKGTIALVGAQVLDGYESTPISDGVVVYQAGVITAVGSVADVQIPANATVIDVGGHTLLPGLIDSHVHVDLIGHGSYERY